MTTTSTSQSRHDELTLFDEKLVFPLLESLILFDMINLERICNGQPSTKFLCNLKSVEVKGCDELKFLVSFSTTKSLPQLQRLTVEDCKNVKEIFAIEREENVNNGSGKIEFFQLRFLTLKHLPRLGSFCSGMTTTSTSQSRHDELTLFDEKLVFPTLEALELECIGSGMIWCSHLPTFMTSSYHNLTSLTVLGCGNLKYIFPTFIVQSFKHLQHLEICECRDLKEIVANGAEATPKFVFPRITFLKLDNLPKLTTFYLGRHLLEWPLLEKLQVCNCKKVKIFTSECGSSNENNTKAQFNISEPALFLIEKINPDLKELIVDSMIPLGILERFNNLKKLKLNGDSDEVLFSCKEEEKHIEIPMKIKHL
ncbi:uncharacterized protein LOC116112033 [Pistacia vera]|uniref:uncharacterized protein LOC116112033 n=1 Tax=Pistacia vera TaxID=55513 RepID=UPI001262CBC1|nr:uncharacterized protein LOC116112033 [Pistacia vera]